MEEVEEQCCSCNEGFSEADGRNQ